MNNLSDIGTMSGEIDWATLITNPDKFTQKYEKRVISAATQALIFQALLFAGIVYLIDRSGRKKEKTK